MKAFFEEIKETFVDGDEEEMIGFINQSLDEGTNALDIITLLSEILEEIGLAFSKGELFLPDMVLAGEQMEMAMEVLNPVLLASQSAVGSRAKVVIGSVAGDIHDIGKNMVKTMLSVSGFEVIDLGADVSAAQFYNAAVSEKPDFIALSSCMTTTVPSMTDTIELLKAKRLTDKMRIIVGGGSMNPKLAESFGECIYGGHDAFEAAQILKKLA